MVGWAGGPLQRDQAELGRTIYYKVLGCNHGRVGNLKGNLGRERTDMRVHGHERSKEAAAQLRGSQRHSGWRRPSNQRLLRRSTEGPCILSVKGLGWSRQGAAALVQARMQANRTTQQLATGRT